MESFVVFWTTVRRNTEIALSQIPCVPFFLLHLGGPTLKIVGLEVGEETLGMAKKYRLRKRLAEDTEYYDKDPIEKYLDYLNEQERLVRVGNLVFDSEAMLRPFACNTELCMKNGVGRKGKKRSCCVDYAPRLSTREREKIDEILPGLVERFPWFRRAIDKAGGFYDWDENFDRIVAKNKKGSCVFITPDAEEFGFHACAIHAYCLENGLSRYDYEPSACLMFPLFLLDVDDEDGTILVTSHSKEVMTMGEDEENYVEVACCKPNEFASEPTYVFMRETLVNMFGAEVWRRLDKALRQREGG